MSQALRGRSGSKMCTDSSNASADKRASTEEAFFSAADMPSANRRAAKTGLLHYDLFRSFDSDIAIKELCDKMAENHALVQMGEELLGSVEDAIAENGTSKFDAQRHFATVKKVWQNGHFNYLLFRTLENQDSFLPTLIQDLSTRERFEERMSRIKEDHYHYFKSIVEVREPVATMSCEDVHPDLDKEKGCTFAVEALKYERDSTNLKLLESLLSTMKMNGNADDMIDALRSDVESSGKREPHVFSKVVVNAIQKATNWLWEEGSPVPELREELFIMELAIELEKSNNRKIVTMAKSFLEKLHSLDLAGGGSHVSLVVKELSEIAAEVLKDGCFVNVLCEKAERDPSFQDSLVPHAYRYTRRESVIAADAEARVARIKKDPFCADILKEREGAAVMRGFLIILIGYYIVDDVDKLLVDFHCGRDKKQKQQDFHCGRDKKQQQQRRFVTTNYQTRFAGDVENLEKLVELQRLSPAISEKLRRLQFKREVLRRQYCYDVHGAYNWLLWEDGTVVQSSFKF